MLISDLTIGEVEGLECMDWSNQDLPWIRDLYGTPMAEDWTLEQN